ncbi:MAG: hypothetical protein ACM3N9_06960, partial [Syntrophothermus sp.]
MQTFVSPFTRFQGKFLWILLFLIFPLVLFSQPFQYNRKIQWESPRKIVNFSGDSVVVMSFTGAASMKNQSPDLPVYIESFPLFTNSDSIVSVRIINPVFMPAESNDFGGYDLLADSLRLTFATTSHHKKPYLNISMVPLLKDASGAAMKLVSFTLRMEVLPG